jgi:hypothetical protein
MNPDHKVITYLLKTDQSLRLPSGLILSDFPAKILYAFLISFPHTCHIPHESHNFLLIKFDEFALHETLHKANVPILPLLRLPWVEISPPKPAFKRPQLILFAYIYGPSFTPIQNK